MAYKGHDAPLTELLGRANEAEIRDAIASLLDRRIALGITRVLAEQGEESVAGGSAPPGAADIFADPRVRAATDSLKARVAAAVDASQFHVASIVRNKLDDDDGFGNPGDQQPGIGIGPWSSSAYSSGPAASAGTGETFFVYGPLMDPYALQRVLSLPEPPRLRPACVTGYRALLWGGCHPAVLPTEEWEGGVVPGVVFEAADAETRDAVLRWHQHHQAADRDYRPEPVSILFDDGSRAQGTIFVFDGDASLLQQGTE